MHALGHDVDASDEFASDVVVAQYVIFDVDVDVLLELHSFCGDEIDDLDFTEGPAKVTL